MTGVLQQSLQLRYHKVQITLPEIREHPEWRITGSTGSGSHRGVYVSQGQTEGENVRVRDPFAGTKSIRRYTHGADDSP